MARIPSVLASSRLLLAVGFLLAAPAAAGRVHLPAPPDAVRWLTPAASGTFVAGDTLAVAWEPGTRFGALDVAVEWELFLSYDGGASWPVRLTPHLDVAVRRQTIRLPELASDGVRLLMRIGDERREYEVELPVALRILPPRAAAVATAGAVRWSATRGEIARPGERGVALWSEGGRDGRHARWLAAPPRHVALTAAQLGELSGVPPAALSERSPRAAAAVESSRGAVVVAEPTASARPAPPERAATVSPRTQTCRRNE